MANCCERDGGQIETRRRVDARRCRLLFCCATLLSFWPTISAVPAADIDWLNAHKDKKITAVRIPSGRITVDGSLDEPQWQPVEPATDFVQTEPHTGQPATERTEVRLLYDERNLYVGVYCFDSAGSTGLVITDVNRDYGPFDNDVFTILLDTFDDDRNAFMFGTNPKGSRREGQVGGDGAVSNFDWDGIWYVKTRITEVGWQLEMAIPFKTLRFREAEEQKWGVNFLRRIRRKNEDTHWSPIPRHYRMNRASLAGTLEGIHGIRQGRNLQVKPYMSAPVTRRQNDDVDFNPDVGLDAKYGITPGLTLDLTANTDFSQVEADEAQVNLTRFSLFFPEKRDFFLENSSIFGFGKFTRAGEASSGRRDLIPFFSRRIGISDGRVVPISGGARLSGRAGKYTLGALSMQANRFRTTPSTNFSVARLRRDVLGRSTVGGIFIDKESGGGRFNRTWGLDTEMKLFNYMDISSFVLRTDAPGIRDGRNAADFSVAWTDRLFDVEGDYLIIGKNFEPEVGFVPRRGIRKAVGEFALTPRPGESVPWIREFRPSTAIEYITDPGNVLQSRRVQSEFSIVFRNSSTFAVRRTASFERLKTPFEIPSAARKVPAGDYNFDEYYVSYASDRKIGRAHV